MNAPQPEWGDDLMAIADATGVTAPRHPDFNIAHRPHPAIAHHFTDLAIELGIRAWATQRPTFVEASAYDVDSPIHLTPAGYLNEATGMWVEDDQHHACIGTDCDRILCVCPDALCAGHTAQACPHQDLLCDECRGECRDCVIDGQDDTEVLG